MDLTDLTIIILSYNRQQCLERVLKYLFESNIKTNILILDASPIQLNKGILESYSSRLLITYKNYTSKKYIFSVPKRVANGSKHITTKYCLLLASDDFVFPSGLKQSIKFLEDNKDFVSCEGICYQHYLKPYLLRKALNLYPESKNPLSNDSNNPLNRIKNYIKGKTDNCHFYAVFKTETFKKIWLKTSQISFDISFGLEEIIPCSLSFVYGKNKVLKIPFSSREPIITKPWKGFINNSNINSIYSKEKLELTSNLLSEELYKLYGLDLENSKITIFNSLNYWVELTEASLSRYSKSFFIFKANLRPILSNFIKYIPRKIGLIRPHIKANLSQSEFKCLLSILQSKKHSQSEIINEIKESRQSYLDSY